MNNTQNQKIAQVTDKTLIIGLLLVQFKKHSR